ncbi:hypothetical protein GCM10010335_09810 [Streptomyces galbus]|nr:hypothetical protein GCM10010335_09810 [Streptomyces galbus]
MPPSRLTNSAGAACTDIDRPVAAAEPVICRTSRFCTVSCIQVPAFDTKFATDHQRMLRWRRERHGERDAGGTGRAAVSGAGEVRGGAADTVRFSTARRGGDWRNRRVTGCAARPFRPSRSGRGPSWQTGRPAPA